MGDLQLPSVAGLLPQQAKKLLEWGIGAQPNDAFFPSTPGHLPGLRSDPSAVFPREFELQVRRQIAAAQSGKARPALVALGEEWSYGTLASRAGRLAWYLRFVCGVKRGDVVAICVDRSFGMVTAIAAVFLTGATYCPVVPANPDARLAYLLRDLGSQVAIASGSNAERLARALDTHGPEEGATDVASFRAITIDLTSGNRCAPDLIRHNGNLQHLDNLSEHAAGSDEPCWFDTPQGKQLQARDETEDACPWRSRPEDLLYILYTSGSTGHPKGVAITHYAFIAAIRTWQQARIFGSTRSLDAGVEEPPENVLQVQAPTFDGHMETIFGPILMGGTCVVLGPEGVLDFARVTSSMRQDAVTYLPITPAVLSQLLVHWSEEIRAQAPDSVEAVSSDRVTVPLQRLFPCLRKIGIAGDAVSMPLLTRLFRSSALPPGEVLPKPRIINIYGPAECTITATWHFCRESDLSRAIVPIGGPLPLYQCWVLGTCDSEGTDKLVGPGEIGELIVGGPVLFEGYWRRPDLTAKAMRPAFTFSVDNPQDRESVVSVSPAAGMFYRTGDLVQWSEDGVLLFVGRKDFQVKIRGQRIELGEVESALAKHPALQGGEIIVLKGQDPSGEAALVAYVQVTQPPRTLAPLQPGVEAPTSSGTAAPGQPARLWAATDKDQDSAEAQDMRASIRKHCQEILPPHMVPAAIVLLARFPLTANGKVDRPRLPPAFRPHSSTGGNQQDLQHIDGSTLQRLSTIWQDLLRVDPEILVQDVNFFDLGGNSLAVGRLYAVILSQFPECRIALADIFKAATLGEQAALLDSRRSSSATAFPPIPVQRATTGPLSRAQKRIYIDAAVNADAAPTLYASPMVWRIRGPVDAKSLIRAWDSVIKDNEVLRTTYHLDPDLGLCQRVQPPQANVFSETLETALDQRISELYASPWDLETGPACRIHLLVAPEEIFCVILVHHIATDGATVLLLHKALQQAYASNSLVADQPARLQYLDFALWEQTQERSEYLKYWCSIFNGHEDLWLPLPYLVDPRSGTLFFRTLETSVIRCPSWTPAMHSGLSELGRQMRMTPFQIILALLQWLLLRATDSKRVHVGVPQENRPHPQTRGLVGNFINMVVFHAEMQPDFPGFLTRVRETCIEAIGNYGMPFDELVEALPRARIPGRTPLFQMSLNFEGGEVYEPWQLAPAVVVTDQTEDYLEKTYRAKFDLHLHFRYSAEIDLGEADWWYATELFAREPIAKLAEQWHQLCRTVLEDVNALKQGLIPASPSVSSGSETLPSLACEPVSRVQAPTKPSHPATATPADSSDPVVELWREILHSPDADDESNFFELGGNSLLCAKFVATVRTKLGVRIALRDFLAEPTLRAVRSLVAAAVHA
eukprot:TRINITY_DN9065_c0_g1_i1.p1 TRINITY_DN9065_c0_g1~~TRINITY_DN9065_c0_g1_i1.p1  ORF type:complete len:1379 (-),score=156.53 TRINITY_DN9065_c0_g1_i1:7-4122(-)